MRSTAPLSTGMQIAIPLSGASAADTGRLALPESPCCRGRHDFPDEPLSRQTKRVWPKHPQPDQTGRLVQRRPGSLSQGVLVCAVNNARLLEPMLSITLNLRTQPLRVQSL